MSAITLFHNNFTQEEELKKNLVSATGYTLLCDRDLLDVLANRFNMEQEAAEKAAFGSKSVFNAFTLEKERVISQLKLIVAEHLMADNVIICGLSALLATPTIGHVLRVGIFDEKTGRMRRAIAEGLSEKKAAKLLAKHDKRAADFAAMLHLDTPKNKSLYDIHINVGELSAREITQTIVEHYRKPAVLPTESSKEAAANFLLAAQIEQTLANCGYTTRVSCDRCELTIKVNQSSFNFEALAGKIRNIAKTIDDTKEINVIASADMAVSIISDDDLFTPPPKVLLVDDEKEFVQTLSERLITRQYGSYPVFDGEQALTCLQTETPDVMVLDLKMPGMQGTEVLQQVKEKHPKIEVIVLTGHGSEQDRTICMEHGAFAYLQKPVDIKELTAVIDKAYAQVAAKRLEKIA